MYGGYFFFSSRRRHTRFKCDWSSDVCSSDLDAMTGKLEEEIPELAARDRVDAGGGLVEKKERWLVQHGAAQNEALFPATGNVGGQALQIVCEAVELDNFVHAAPQARGLQGLDAALELHVFRD